MNRTEKLLKDSILRLLLSFSAPAIAGMLVMALYGVVGGIYVGRGVGSAALSGLALSFPVTMIMIGFAMISALGATSLVSLALGEGRKNDAQLLLGNALTSSICIALIVMIPGFIFIKPILLAFGADAESLPYAVTYSRIMICGMAFQSAGFTLNNVIRGEGNPPVALITSVLGFSSYAVLAYVLIFIFHAGIAGAGYAALVSQIIMLAWTLAYFRSGRSVLRLHIGNMKIRKKILLNIYAIGAAPFVMQVAGSLIIVYVNHQLGRYGGNTAIAAMGVAFSIYNLVLMPLFGINQGMQPIIGFNYGARKFARAKQTLVLAMLFATSICVAGFTVIMLFNRQIMGIFVKDNPAVISIGAHGLSIFLLALPLIGFQIIGTAYFQAVGKPRETLFLSMLRQLLFLLPLLIILPHYYGLDGVWMAGPLSDTASALVTAVLLWYELAHLKRRHAQESTRGRGAHPETAACPPDREVGGIV